MFRNNPLIYKYPFAYNFTNLFFSKNSKKNDMNDYIKINTVLL